MRLRKDGEQTRRRILKTACEVFGRKGYRDATHAELCRRARVNIASINYHFGSKDALYRDAWGHAAEEVDRRYPFHGGVAASAPADVRLRGNIRAILHRNLDERLACFHRIRMMELLNPTGLLDEAFSARLRRARAHTLGILRELLGARASTRKLELCELSLISQCRMVLQMPRGGWRSELPTYSCADVDELVDHIARFTLAGIAAMRRRDGLRRSKKKGMGRD